MDINELYWAAGFVEGEGYFSASIKYRGNIQTGVSQVQKAPLERLQRLFGGRFRIKKYKGGKYQDQWVWYTQGAQAVGIMMTLYALMSPRRKEQIRKVLALWKTWGVRAAYRSTCKRGHPLDGIDCRGRRRCILCTQEKWKLRARADRAIERQALLARGEPLPVHKRLTDEQVVALRTRVASKELTQAQACREYGLSPAGVHKLMYGELRADVAGPLLNPGGS